MSMDACMSLLKEKHPISDPNEGFMAQLAIYASGRQKIYKCRKCRTLIADVTNSFRLETGEVLIDPQIIDQDPTGKLACANCSAKLGTP